MTQRSKLAFCSISALDRPLAAVAELAAGLGLDGLEVTARPPHLEPGAPRAAARAAGRAVRAAGLEVVAHGSYLGRPPQLGPEDARHEAVLARELGAPLLRCWAEPQPGTDDFGRVVAMLRAACDELAPDAAVVVERHVGSWADTPERIAQLLDAVERPNLALNYQVLDLLPPDAVPDQPADARRLVPRARYLHLKNYRPNPDPAGPLLPGGSLEKGVLDYRAILAAVFAAGYLGPLGIEFLSHEPRPVDEKLAEDLTFLRRVLGELGRA